MELRGVKEIIGVFLQYPKGFAEQCIEGLMPNLDLAPGEPYLTIESPCGEVLTIKKREDFPQEDVPCSCGDPNHWFVKHREVSGP